MSSISRYYGVIPALVWCWNPSTRESWWETLEGERHCASRLAPEDIPRLAACRRVDFDLHLAVEEGL